MHLEVEDIIKKINRLTENFKVGDKVTILDSGRSGTIISKDEIADTYIVKKSNGVKDIYFDTELIPFNNVKAIAHIYYGNQLITDVELSQYVGESIPQYFDKNNFKVKVDYV